jgi:hypothetical protein
MWLQARHSCSTCLIEIVNRTHRQRTQGYIRELEKEVLRLRDSERALKYENANLKRCLSGSGILAPEVPSPTSSRGNVSSAEPVLFLPEPSSLTVETSSAASVIIDLTDLSAIEPEKWCSVTAAMEEVRPYELPTVSPAQLSGDPSGAMPATLREGSVGNYGASPALSPQAAIDFVLEYVLL